jgi:signal peptidase I
MVLTPESADTRVALELTSFDNRFRAEVSADGGCTLTSTTAGGTCTQSAALGHLLEAGKDYKVVLTHADLEATLWVDGRPVLRTTSKEYDVTYSQLKKLMQSSDSVPRPDVKIVGLGGKFEVKHVQLMRDVYYTCPQVYPVKDGAYGEFARDAGVTQGTPGWGTTGHPIELAGGGKEESDLDQFFVLGDNSPQSLDGRAWTDAAPTLRLWDDKGKPIYQLGTVPRYSMKGKAMFVYWPAGYRLLGWPILPNVGRMRLIR